MHALLNVIMLLLNLYIYVMIASAILSWLVAFDVVNQRSQVVRTIGEVLWNLTEPVLRPIRRVMPNLGSLDLSPIVVLILIYFIQQLIMEYAYSIAF